METATFGEPGALGSARKKLEYILEPVIFAVLRGLLNKVRLRAWDQFPVVVNIEVKDLASEEWERKAGQDGSRDLRVEKNRFQELVHWSG